MLRYAHVRGLPARGSQVVVDGVEGRRRLTGMAAYDSRGALPVPGLADALSAQGQATKQCPNVAVTKRTWSARRLVAGYTRSPEAGPLWYRIRAAASESVRTCSCAGV